MGFAQGRTGPGRVGATGDAARSLGGNLALEAETLDDLGLYDYLPAKRLHLFALRAAVDAFQISACRCHTSFPHHATGLPTLEVDAYAWKPLNRLDAGVART